MGSPTTLFAALALAAAMALMGPASASVFEPREFRDDAQRIRYGGLIEELRCLVCQNQNLADSDADLAADLRNEVYRMVRAGQSDEDIVRFMVDRYGDFVLYRPPFNMTTVALWTGPFIVLLGGLGLLAWQIKAHMGRAAGVGMLSDAEREELDSLLK